MIPSQLSNFLLGLSIFSGLFFICYYMAPELDRIVFILFYYGAAIFVPAWKVFVIISLFLSVFPPTKNNIFWVIIIYRVVFITST
jgi:uncharacterized paraquat-inducible protein A